MTKRTTFESERVMLPIDEGKVRELVDRFDNDPSLTMDEQVRAADVLSDLADDIAQDPSAAHELVIEFKRAPCAGCLSLHAGVALLSALEAL